MLNQGGHGECRVVNRVDALIMTDDIPRCGDGGPGLEDRVVEVVRSGPCLLAVLRGV